MFRKYHPRSGARPGTLLIPPGAPPTRIRVVKYSPDSLADDRAADVAGLHNELGGAGGGDHVVWIDVQGFGDGSELEQIARQFDIHPLAMEDIVNVPQRPKAEAHGAHLLVITRHADRVTGGSSQGGQLSIVVGPGYVLTFDDAYHDRLEAVRQRLESPSSRLRNHGADYLAYALLDTIVDEYYPVLSTYGERLEQLERFVVEKPDPRLLQEINMIKNRLVNLRRTFWPQQDAVRSLVLDETGLIGETARTFLRDTYDHCVQISEVVEMYRETATGLLNLYMSAVAHRSNEVMKVLTIMSSIFVPMTFVAGVYGMNFENMPELGFAWSYPAIWAVMLGSAAGMLWFFHRKGWIQVSRLLDAPDAETRDSVDGLAKVPAGEQLRVLDHDQLLPGSATAAAEPVRGPAADETAGRVIQPRRRHAA